MAVAFETNAGEAEILNMEAKPLPASPQAPQQNQNKNFRKVAIRIKIGRTGQPYG